MYCATLAERAPIASRLTKRGVARTTAIDLEAQVRFELANIRRAFQKECFFHCAKAFKRSRLWQPAEWPDRSGLAPPAQVFLDHAKPVGATVEDVERRLEESYTKRLY